MTDHLDALLEITDLASLEEIRKQQIAAIDKAQRKIIVVDGLIDLLRNPNNGATPATVSAASRPNLPAAVYKIMESEDRSWTREEIYNALASRAWMPQGKTPGNALDATLSRLSRAGKVERLAKGMYRLPAR